MEDLLKKYEAGVLAYKNGNYEESQRILSPFLSMPHPRSPDEKMLNALAYAMYGRLGYAMKSPGKRERYSLGVIETDKDMAPLHLSIAAQNFYSLGAERHAGYILPFCGTLMMEKRPAAGLRTIYDGIHRLKSSGAPLKALAIETAKPLIVKRLLTYLRFSVYEATTQSPVIESESMDAHYVLGECLLLEGLKEEALYHLAGVYEYYKKTVEEHTRVAQSPAIIESMEMHLNYVRWTVANAADDRRSVRECIDYANSYGDWLAWFPGPYTKFPDAPHCELDLREYPPFDFLSDLYVPFSDTRTAAAYWGTATEILGSYGGGIPAETLKTAKMFLEAAVEIYKEQEDFQNAARATVCLVEARIRQNREGLNLNEDVNFALQYLDSEKDANMLTYLKAMVIPEARLVEG